MFHFVRNFHLKVSVKLKVNYLKILKTFCLIIRNELTSDRPTLLFTRPTIGPEETEIGFKALRCVLAKWTHLQVARCIVPSEVILGPNIEAEFFILAAVWFTW